MGYAGKEPADRLSHHIILTFPEKEHRDTFQRRSERTMMRLMGNVRVYFLGEDLVFFQVGESVNSPCSYGHIPP